ncbi:hypothetical protein, partial [Chryseobacterium sp. SIMBA_028]
KTYQAILSETGMVKPEVIRQIRRCLTESSPGQIIGFFALIRHRRIKSYVRVKPVEPDQLSSSAGAAGALGKLFREHPKAQKFVDRR